MTQVSPSLPLDVWATVHAALNDDAIPFRTKRHVVGMFEAAMKTAQEPQPEPVAEALG